MKTQQTQQQREIQEADPISTAIIATFDKIREHKYVPRETMGDTPTQASRTSHSPLPLIASVKVDKWLDDLRKILVDRSEFKLADHVVSARVVIKMLEKQRCEAKAHAQRLADERDAFAKALQRLIGELPLVTDAECRKARDAGKSLLAQWEEESPADADALEALDQLEQLEGGE